MRKISMILAILLICGMAAGQSIQDFIDAEKKATIQKVNNELNDLLTGIELHREAEEEFRQAGAKNVPIDLWITKNQDMLINRYTLNTMSCLDEAVTEKNMTNFQNLIDSAYTDIERMRGIAICKAIEEFKYRGYGEFADWNKACSDWKALVKKGYDKDILVCDKLRLSRLNQQPTP